MNRYGVILDEVGFEKMMESWYILRYEFKVTLGMVSSCDKNEAIIPV